MARKRPQRKKEGPKKVPGDRKGFNGALGRAKKALRGHRERFFKQPRPWGELLEFTGYVDSGGRLQQALIENGVVKRERGGFVVTPSPTKTLPKARAAAPRTTEVEVAPRGAAPKKKEEKNMGPKATKRTRRTQVARMSPLARAQQVRKAIGDKPLDLSNPKHVAAVGLGTPDSARTWANKQSVGNGQIEVFTERADGKLGWAYDPTERDAPTKPTGKAPAKKAATKKKRSVAQVEAAIKRNEDAKKAAETAIKRTLDAHKAAKARLAELRRNTKPLEKELEAARRREERDAQKAADLAEQVQSLSPAAKAALLEKLGVSGKPARKKRTTKKRAAKKKAAKKS